MNQNEIIAYCLTKKKSYIDYPFGDIPICIKVNKKIFAQIYPNANDFKITLKCEPMFGDFYRNVYPNTVVRGYYCPPVQQPFWNTIYMNSIVSDEEIKIMIDHAYQIVIEKLPKKVKKEILEG